MYYSSHMSVWMCRFCIRCCVRRPIFDAFQTRWSRGPYPTRYVCVRYGPVHTFHGLLRPLVSCGCRAGVEQSAATDQDRLLNTLYSTAYLNSSFCIWHAFCHVINKRIWWWWWWWWYWHSDERLSPIFSVSHLADKSGTVSCWLIVHCHWEKSRVTFLLVDFVKCHRNGYDSVT